MEGQRSEEMGARGLFKKGKAEEDRTKAPEPGNVLALNSRSNRGSNIDTNAIEPDLTGIASETNRPSQRTALFMVLFAGFVLLTTSGIVFGYAAIKPVLIAEGAYSHLCAGEADYDPLLGCTKQLLRLNLMIIVVPVVMNAATLVGIAGDRYGPRFMSLLGTFIFSGGIILLAFSSANFSGYLPGFCLLAFGGCTIFLGFLHLATLFPERMGLVNSLLNGAFDGSTFVMTMFRYLTEHTGVELKVLWLSCLSVCVLNIIYSFVYLAPRPISYTTLGPDLTPLECSISAEDLPARPRPVPRSLYNLRHLHWKKQLMSTELLLAVLFIAAVEMHMIFYIATLHEQLEDMFDEAAHKRTLANFFDIVLPLESLLCVPLVGLILDRLGLVFIFWTVAIVQLVAGLLQLVPVWWVQMPQMVCFIFFRACMYASVSDFCGRMFGYTTFGKTYAAIMSTAGLANLSSYGLDYVAKNTLNGNYTLVNAALTLLSPLTFILPVYLQWKNKRLERMGRGDAGSDQEAGETE